MSNFRSSPVQRTDLHVIEELLLMKIMLFSFYEDTGQARYAVYISKQSEDYLEIYLLFWEGH